MPPAAATGPRPSPQAAYAQWIGACTEAGWRGAPEAEPVPVADALGRVTAAPVRARWPSPRSACAAMDGIAISAGSADAAGSADVAGPADTANSTDTASVWRLAASAFAWVDTGDRLPEGMDTVVERERVQLGADGSARITGPAPRGLNVRARGEDFQGGQLLIPAGHRLRPADLAAAAAAGHAALEAARRPVAAIIPTGDEIRPVGSALGPGQVTDSNSVLLALRAGEAGARPLVSDVQPDDPEALAAELRRAAPAADLVLVIAGSSAGRSDHTAAVIAQVGGVAVRGVAVRPGHPVLLGQAGPGGVPAVPVIGVPGYPLAAAVIFELFAAPLLAALQGGQPPDRVWQRARLACDWTSSPDVEDWVPVSLAGPASPASAPAGLDDGGAALVTPGRRGAGGISRLMRAHAWWPIPIGQGKFARGEHVDIQLIPGAPR
jgi:molybdopterin molybdotransferase/putative molybdopterin biosynthesis protein